MIRRSGADRARGREDGQALVLFVGGLVTILSVVGLVIDGGVAFVNRREAQNIADLSALSGTRVLADHYRHGGRTGADVYAAVASTAGRNSCLTTDAPPCTWNAYYIRQSGTNEQNLGVVGPGGSIPNGAQGVVVQVTRTPSTFFLGVIGRAQWDVRAESAGYTARMGGLPPGQVLPIGVDPPNDNFQRGKVYRLFAGKDGPGNFSWLSWNGRNDAGNLADSLCEPNNPAITFPAWIDGDPGKTNASRVRACVDKWIENGRTVLIPLWDQVRGQGNSFEFRIRGVAAFVLTGHGNPAIDTIDARFVEYYPLPTLPAGYGPAPCGVDDPDCLDQSTFVGVLR